MGALWVANGPTFLHADEFRLRLDYADAMTDLQWRSQNTETVTHIKVKLLDQEMVLFDCVHLQMGTKSLLQEGMENHFCHINFVTSLECFYFYYASA